MLTARELVGFTFNAQTFIEHGATFVTSQTKRKTERAIRQINGIAARHGRFRAYVPQNAKEIVHLFLQHCRGGVDSLLSVFDTSFKARKLAWTLTYETEHAFSIVESMQHLSLALKVLEHRWRPHALAGVFDALLKKWGDKEVRAELQSFIRSRLDGYEGRLSSVHKIKEQRAFFLDRRAAVNLSNHLFQEGRTLSDVWDVVDLPQHLRGSPYFRDVAVAYTTSAMRAPSYKEQVLPILEFLRDHGSMVSYKRCLPLLIRRLDRDEPSDLRERLLQVAFREIGDPAHESQWQADPGASEQQAAQLEESRKILNNWIAQRFISAFFDKVAMDSDRREFWLRYTPHMTNFKVFGDRRSRRQLRRDERIRDYINARFLVVGGSMSAIMMRIEDRVIVEFGETGGACYIYQAGKETCPSFDERYRHISQLKVGVRFPLLMRYSGSRYYRVKDEGRFLHSHNWQRRLDWWMGEKLGIRV